MTVTADQVAKAKAKGLINVEALAVACDKFKVPFYLAATIMERETGGDNIFGHDAGGAYSVPNKDIPVTEARYKDFLKQIGAGKTSNGVGPMQLTYRGYHIGPVSLTARGFKAWEPADNILYGVEILSKSLKTQLAKKLSIEKAFWNVAKIYNAGKLDGPAGVNYANGAAASAKTWKAAVGTADTEPTPPPVTPPEEPMPLTQEDWDRLHALIQSTVTSPTVLAKIATAVWTTDGIIPAGKTETDTKNTAWRPATFLRLTYDDVTDLIKKP